MLRSIILLSGPEHMKIEALTAVARCSSGLILTRNKLLGGVGIMGSIISKLSHETQAIWFPYWGRTSEEDEIKAFRRWLAIKETAAEILRNHKMAAALFKAGDSEPSKSKATYADNDFKNQIPR